VIDQPHDPTRAFCLPRNVVARPTYPQALARDDARAFGLPAASRLHWSGIAVVRLGPCAALADRPRRARRAAHHARSLLHRCRRRLPDEHRRRGVDDRARDLCGHRDDRPRPVSLTARNASRESAWRHVRDRSMACSRGRARPGKGILGRVRTVPHSAPSPRHITERVLRDTPRARTTKSLLSPSSVPVGVRRISSGHCNSSSESCSVGVAKSKRLRG
jgi:hypothetical protein